MKYSENINIFKDKDINSPIKSSDNCDKIRIYLNSNSKTYNNIIRENKENIIPAYNKEKNIDII
jgi:hypothetical protein